jgi:pyruvate/2-oxoglutarate dehydrogenase complex dihydrolipoamide acyltransferase (E2) component
MTPLAKTMMAQGGFSVPAQGSGVSGRIRAADLVPATPTEAVPAIRLHRSSLLYPAIPAPADEIQAIPVKGIRKLIATRMLQSLQTTATAYA